MSTHAQHVDSGPTIVYTSRLGSFLQRESPSTDPCGMGRDPWTVASSAICRLRVSNFYPSGLRIAFPILQPQWKVEGS